MIYPHPTCPSILAPHAAHFARKDGKVKDQTSSPSAPCTSSVSTLALPSPTHLLQDGELSPEELREGFVKFAPLRTAPGMGAYNSDFVSEINADADSLCAAPAAAHWLATQPKCTPCRGTMCWMHVFHRTHCCGLGSATTLRSRSTLGSATTLRSRMHARICHHVEIPNAR